MKRGRSFDANEVELAKLVLAEAQVCPHRYLCSITRCLSLLLEQEIWGRPNTASNCAGNLVLHLCGNVRQWIISGLGGAPDVRQRDAEFAERGPVARRSLIAKLRETVREADHVLARLPPEALLRRYSIQGFRVSGVASVAHVAEHFSHHAGQIIYLTKLKRGKNLRFTRLPGIRRRR
jgi:uncharacterized damage-inducible protein DinB